VFCLGWLTFGVWQVGGIRYADGSRNRARIGLSVAESAHPTTAEPTEDEEAQPLIFEIEEFSIDGASVGITDEVPVIPFFTLVESIDFTLRDLSTSPGDMAAQEFTLALGEGSQLRWRGDLSLAPFSSAGELQLFGRITHMAYRFFQAQFPVGIMGGWFDASMRYELGLLDEGGFNAQVHDLQASLSDLDIVTRGDRTRLVLLPSVEISGGELNLLERRVQLARIQLDDL